MRMKMNLHSVSKPPYHNHKSKSKKYKIHTYTHYRTQNNKNVTKQLTLIHARSEL